MVGGQCEYWKSAGGCTCCHPWRQRAGWCLGWPACSLLLFPGADPCQAEHQIGHDEQLKHGALFLEKATHPPPVILDEIDCWSTANQCYHFIFHKVLLSVFGLDTRTHENGSSQQMPLSFFGLVLFSVFIFEALTKCSMNSQNANCRMQINSLPAKSCYGREKKSDSYFQVGTYRMAGTVNEYVFLFYIYIGIFCDPSIEFIINRP